MQYVDDTIFLMQDNLKYARKLKFILVIFEQMFGLKINFQKSEVYCFGNAIDKKSCMLIFSLVLIKIAYELFGGSH